MFIFAADNLKSSLTNGARIGVNLLADLDNKRFIVENLTFLSPYHGTIYYHRARDTY